MDVEEYKRASLQNWDAMAAGWERSREAIEEVSTPVREWLIRELAPQPGHTVLELAAGPGETGFEAARHIRDSGWLISTDFSSEMVEVARRRSTELGLLNVEHRVMDAERLELDDESVNGVICRYGYMLMPDPRAACSETRRVLRQGGRVTLAVWREAERNPWISIAGRMLVERGLMPRPQPGTPGLFTFADEERLQGLLESSGFSVGRMEDVRVRFVYRDVDDYVERARATGGSFATAWHAASEDERDAIRAGLDEAFQPFAVDGSYELPGVALCCVAS
jgi:SAM-dependent methyltransferase